MKISELIKRIIKKAKFVFIPCIVMLLLLKSYDMLFQRLAYPNDNYLQVLSKPDSRGEEVSLVQKFLSEIGLYTGAVNGIYDIPTSDAVRRYQLYNGLEGSGVCDDETLNKMGLSGTADSALQLEEARLRLIGLALDSCAENESYLIKTALAAVILNREASPLFPDTLEGVVFFCDAFAAKGGKWGKEASDESLRAARDAACGFDPINGALRFSCDREVISTLEESPCTILDGWIFY